jgi:hypothetical protein
MKSHRLMALLLAGFLALPFCPKTAGFTLTYAVANDISADGCDGSMESDSSSLGDFSASVSAYCSVASSSARAAQSISYYQNVFMGEGSLKILGPDTTLIASAETSVEYFIHVDGQATYLFEYNIESKGDASGAVGFNGDEILDNGNGTFGGTLVPGVTYMLHAGNAPSEGQSAGSGTWRFVLSVTPTNVPPRFTEVQKAAFRAAWLAESEISTKLFLEAEKATTPAQRTALESAARSEEISSYVLYSDYLDPLDTNYTVLAQEAMPELIPLAVGGGITQMEADDYNLWLTNLAQTAACDTALDASLDRAQGAASVSNSFWETAQMNAAVQFEAQLAGLLDQEPILRSDLVAQFETNGFTAITVSTNDALNLQIEISSNGLPSELLDELTALGTDAQTITNIEFALLTADPTNMAGSFPQSLTDTNLDSAARSLAANLRDASLTMINAAFLPTGQFRFDLPTEPGYGYTIGSSQNLADPASWTTIVSNIATSTLLSFTNAPPSGAPAIFYRASHN